MKILTLLVCGLGLLACRSSAPVPAKAPAATAASADLAAELAQFSRFEIPVDATVLPAGDVRAARKLVEAGALIERAFWRQSYRGGWELRETLERSADPLDRLRLDLLRINAGPFDRLRKYQPFYGQEPRPKGGGFYPEDLTAQELDAYLAAHPGEKEALLSPWTAVRRQGDRLVAVPFHQEYGEWIRPASALIREAAGLVTDSGMASYLRARAEALTTDSYGESDRLFLATRGSALVVVVGPQSTSYDQLKRVKQAYSMMVGIADTEENRRVAAYLAHLDELEGQLPLAERHRRHGIQPQISIEAVLDLHRAGSAAHGSLGSMVLPANPKARPDGGRNIFWKNVLEARGAAVIRPIAQVLLVSGEEARVTPRAYFQFNLTHYVAHNLGPVTAESGKPVKDLLGDAAEALDETKAELAGLAVLDWGISRNLLPASLAREHYATLIPHTFQILAQGIQGSAPPAHDKQARLVLNWCREKGALSSAADGRWRIDEERLPGALRELLAEILEIQAAGDGERASRLLDRYMALGPELQAAAERIGTVRPITFEPVFKVRWP
jgi:hypothetical protein